MIGSGVMSCALRFQRRCGSWSRGPSGGEAFIAVGEWRPFRAGQCVLGWVTWGYALRAAPQAITLRAFSPWGRVLRTEMDGVDWMDDNAEDFKLEI